MQVIVNPFCKPIASTYAAIISYMFAKKIRKIDLEFDIELENSPRLNININFSSQIKNNETNETFFGFCVAEKLCKISGLYSNNCDQKKIEYFINLAKSSTLLDRNNLLSNCNTLNNDLLNQNFLAGQQFCAADLLIWPVLKENARQVSLLKNFEQQTKNSESKDENLESKNVSNLVQQYRSLEAMDEFCETRECLQKQRSLLVKQKAKSGRKENKNKNSSKTNKNLSKNSIDIGIEPNMLGKVVTRFPPEPSGFLHIGHAKAVLLNQKIAELWKGKMIVRFDDTNPTKEKSEYAENILMDLKTLGVNQSRITHTSDYFDQILEICTDLIQRNLAYVDSTPVEQMRIERKERTESMCKNQSVEENLKLWKLMQKGDTEGLDCVVRAKMDMQSLNGTLRDPTLYRCNIDTPHLRTGFKYKVYPTYDFACPIVDSIEGVTHAFRTSEYTDRNEQYDRIQDMAIGKSQLPFLKGLTLPNINVYSRLNFIKTVLSKRKLKQFVENEFVSGQNDPRFPTVQGMMRRGLTLQALTEFIYEQGFTLTNTMMEWDKIWAINKKILDQKVSRYIAVSDNFVRLNLTDGPDLQLRSVNLHPKYSEYGKKVIRIGKRILLENHDINSIKDGDEITLIEWGNVIIDGRKSSDDGNGNIELFGHLNLEGDFKKTLKVNWLADSGVDLTPCTIVELDYLIKSPKIDPGVDLQDIANYNSWKEEKAVGDPNLRNLEKGTIIQLQRRGFAIVDRIISDDMSESERVVLIMIPDGRSKSVISKEGSKKQNRQSKKPS